ncbi:phosphatase 2C-like domain-containing protein [Sporodiniella umbellata]|nr:phosphatase 2C-like domain-containing protein [Sporodiniella umbellata]
MGQTLSEPVTTKDTTEGIDSQLMYGTSSMQGWRESMEDAHISLLNEKAIALFAVMDGHGGKRVAQYSRDHLAQHITCSEKFKKGDIRQSLIDSFLEMDQALYQQFPNDTSGCTAIVALLKEKMLYIANVGDSRAVICKQGKAFALSKDHKPYDPIEYKRIKESGNSVYSKRVNGTLALSRALGDFKFKRAYHLSPEKQAVTAYPDIQEYELTKEDEFMVLACDGIWDCMTNQQVVDFIRSKLNHAMPLAWVCERLLDHCLADHRRAKVGLDNMTVQIVAFLSPCESKEQWYSNIQSSVQRWPSTVACSFIRSESRDYSCLELENALDLY